MNQIDCELLEAWMRIGAFATLSPREALRRARRLSGAVFRRPMRAWCLALRASDTRITSRNACILPLQGEMLGLDECGDDLVRAHRAHTVTLCGETIRELTRPVFIPYPGLNIDKAARKLGLTRKLLYAWIAAGTVKISHFQRGRWGRGYGGKRRPIVYTPSPLDPNRGAGRPPNPVWGSLWQSHWQDMPEGFQQTFVRTPRFKTIRGRHCFNGWEWRCGGRHSRQTNNGFCARACSLVYLPLQAWTIGKSGHAPLQLALPEGCGLAGAWHPGECDVRPHGYHDQVGDQRPELGDEGGDADDSSDQPPKDQAESANVDDRPRRVEHHARPPRFKCNHCWQVRGCAMANRHGWHDFVTVISGGLLHGSEVERPEAEAPHFRRRREYKHVRRRAPRREQVLEGILRGERYAQIASRAGMTYRAVNCQAALLFKMHGVHSREELLHKLRTENLTHADAG